MEERPLRIFTAVQIVAVAALLWIIFSRSGPCDLQRSNPIYVFGVVMIAGVVLVLHWPILWLLFLAIVVPQTVRARREAQVLEAAFGDAYRHHRRKTWF
jgi:hypothetical protein